MELQTLTQEAILIVREVGDFLNGELGKVSSGAVEVKSMNSLVSYVDKTAEQMLVQKFAELLPGSTFLTEEGTVAEAQSTYRWVIDPLDGTTNFLHRLPCFAISVALQKNGQTQMGIVLEVSGKECFYAWKNGGTYLNGTPVKVSPSENLQDSLIATGFPYYDFSRKDAYFKAFEAFMRQTRGIRRFGAAAVDLAYVACGRFNAFFEYSLQPWDIAAGAFLVEEAGGVVSDFQGKENDNSGREILAASAKLHPACLQIVKKSFH